MAKRTLPGLGLVAFWPLGDDTYKDEMDADFRALSLLTQLGVSAALAADPGAPAQGDAHILTTNGHVRVYDDGAWVDFTPRPGWIAYVADPGEHRYWDGDSWEPLGGDLLPEGDDGEFLSLVDGQPAWVPAPEGGGGGDGVEEAPEDGTAYSRKDAGWVPSPTGGGGGGGGGGSPKPILADFTVVNAAGGTTFTQSDESIYIDSPYQGDSDHYDMIVRNVPATPYARIGRISIANARDENFISYGMVLRNSVSGQLLAPGCWFNSYFPDPTDYAFRTERMNSPTSDNGEVGTPTYLKERFDWFKITDDGTTLSVFFSLDGYAWRRGYFGPNTSFGGFDQIGFYINNRHAAGGTTTSAAISYYAATEPKQYF